MKPGKGAVIITADEKSIEVRQIKRKELKKARLNVTKP